MCDGIVGDSHTRRHGRVPARATSMLVGVASAVLLAQTGCGAVETKSEPIEVFAAEFRTSFCGSLETCCVDYNFSRAVCESAMRWLDAASTGRRGAFVYHEAEAVRCLEDLGRTDVCLRHVPASCARVFEGLLGPGDACESELECPPDPGGSMSCVLDTDGVHRCVGAARLGEPCAWTCDEDGLCYPSGESPVGSTCYVADGLHCASNGRCESLVPVERLALAPSCDPNELDPCRGRPCNDALCGEPASFICVIGLGSVTP